MQQSKTDMEIRFLKSRFFRTGTLALLGLLVLALLLICLVGQSQQYVGWLERERAVALHDSSHSTGPSSIYARIKNKNPLFRGNDLFRVTSPEIQTDEKILEQNWDTGEGRGRVHLSLENPLASDEILLVNYRLSVRWAKLLPFLFSLFMAILAIIFCYKIISRPELIHDRRAMVAAHLTFFLAVATVVCLNLSSPGWSYGDDQFMLKSTVRGNFLHSTVWPEVGRFFPLGLVDLNLLIPFGDRPLAYALEQSAILVLFMGVMYCGIKRTAGPLIACILATSLLFLPQMTRIYSDAIFPESRLVLLLSVFFLLYYLGDQSKKSWPILLGCIAACWATYTKEPVFGLFIVFALTQILFGYAQLSRPQRLANFFLLLNGIVFLSLYCWICFGGESYAEHRNDGSITSFGLLGGYLLNPFLSFAVLCGLWRAYRILFKQDRRLLKYDGALYAGLAYTMAFALLKLEGDYYLTPTYVCYTFAVAGYLASLQHKMVHRPTSQAYQATAPISKLNWRRIKDPHVQLASLVAMFILLTIHNASPSISQVKRAAEDRRATRTLTNLFQQLQQQGFQIYTYTPQGMGPFAKMVQDYRREVLNVFDFNAQPHPPKGGAWRDHLPFQKLHPDAPSNETANETAKMIVIHDMNYSISELNNQRSPDHRLEFVAQIPSVMSAGIFAQPEHHAKIYRLANGQPTTFH